MKGKDWNGNDIDMTTRLRPYLAVITARQETFAESGRDTSARAGHSSTWWCNVVGHYGMVNPNLSRMARIAEVMGMQEFGLFLYADDEYRAYTLYDVDEPEANPRHLARGRWIFDFSVPLAPLYELLRLRRRERYGFVYQFAAAHGFHRSTILDLESPKKNYNPSLGRLSWWAKAVGVQEFGVYVLIDGEYTEVDVLHDNETEDGE